ncbi:hypothetical protein BGZ50_006525 [Haplosporangium sp. Z 11]|nr:hypothetical protein BGZ50_006525 [Haplosporangium sp. Z 11]
MLAFGLTVIVLFIRLHGDGYDFPVQVAKCRDELEFQRPPDRTYMEISGVYHDDFRDWSRGHDLDYKDEDENMGVHGYDHAGSERVEHTRAGHGSGSRNIPEGKGGDSAPDRNRKDLAQNFVAGWNTQWHLGGKKKTRERDDVSETRNSDAQGNDDIKHGHAPDDDQWIWMTNIWHDDGECGPAWELMYTHRFPGLITHSSLSKRVVPEQTMDDHLEDKDGKMIPRPRGRESIRLAVVYKVVRDERVSYHSRIYHFGTFQNHEDIKECGSTSTETCHRSAPFLNFDYVLPGSTPIKDFSLEHDTILYSRLSDTAAFRSLKLPRLQVGSTSSEHPFALSYGVPGPTICNGSQPMILVLLS